MTDENTVTEQTNEPVVAAVPGKPDRLGEVDRLALELAKSGKATALAEAKTAIANNEKAELAYRYVVLQLYMKYGLTASDALKETGEIMYGGAGQEGQQG